MSTELPCLPARPRPLRRKNFQFECPSCDADVLRAHADSRAPRRLLHQETSAPMTHSICQELPKAHVSSTRLPRFHLLEFCLLSRCVGCDMCCTHIACTSRCFARFAPSSCLPTGPGCVFRQRVAQAKSWRRFVPRILS